MEYPFSELITQLQLKEDELVSEEKIITAISWRIQDLLDKSPDTLFSLLYRLDISEKNIKEALKDNEVDKKIALLIYERQLEKIKSRKINKSEKPTDDLAW